MWPSQTQIVGATVEKVDEKWGEGTKKKIKDGSIMGAKGNARTVSRGRNANYKYDRKQSNLKVQV